MASTPAPSVERHAAVTTLSEPDLGMSVSPASQPSPVWQELDYCACLATTSIWNSTYPSVPDSPLDSESEGGGDTTVQMPLMVTRQTSISLGPRQNADHSLGLFPAPAPISDFPAQTTPLIVLARNSPTTVFLETDAPGSTSRSIYYYSSFTTTLPNSSVVVVLTTVSSGASSTATSQAAHSQGSVNSALGPLLGGLLGGFFGLMVIGILLWCTWRRRHDICGGRQPVDPTPAFPETDPKIPEHLDRRSSRFSSQFSGYRSPRRSSTPAPEPLPYQYGALGRPKSVGSTTSLPGAQSPPHSPSQSHSRPTSSTTPPPSAYLPNASVGTPPGIATALTPGPSMASSLRSSTPASWYPPSLQQYQQQRQQGRVSWPRMAGEEEERVSPVLRPRSERRPSRLSLTLANWNPETDENVMEREETDVGAEDTSKKKTKTQEEGGAGVEVEVTRDMEE
ncbi:predicted protein [Sparassis crispa]|uniref:Mid2 domain-containing protein n=1 Tax=Sparassis crispa TaxID=139825 RepID=A0A401GF54_9APHY|nr:predicted protein [Sparassis crispa]GBE80789.1 predicted protein [Sparassis crispa]